MSEVQAGPARTTDQAATGGAVRAPSLGSAAPSRSFDRLAMFTFVTLGLPDGMIGTAWPTLRHRFGVPLGDLGLLLLVGTLGALASASVAGLVFGRIGARATIMLGALAGAVGALGIAVSQTFLVFVISGTAIGLAAGLFDSTLNTSMALAGRNRLLNFLHGCYGVGSSVGPLVVTAALLAGSWRAGYGVLVGTEVLLLLGWWLSGRHPLPVTPAPAPVPASAATLPPPPPEATPGRGQLPTTSGGVGAAAVTTARRRLHLAGVVGLGLFVFMVYVGLEAGAGQWEPSFDRGPLHMGAGGTGLATFGYWGALTLVRFALAVPRRQLSPAAVVRWGCAIALGAAGLVWWRPSDVAALIGLVIIGGALAGVFPALVTLTPARVGDDLAHHVIGWQVGAAGLGGSFISATFGVVFQRYGLRDFGPALVTVGVLLMLGVLVLERAPLHRATRTEAG